MVGSLEDGTNRNLAFPRFLEGEKQVISGWMEREEGEGRRYSLEFAFGLRNLHERETRRVWPRRVVSGPSLLLFQAFKAAVVVFLSTRHRHAERKRERESQAFISQVTRARDWRSIKGRFTRPDSDANRRKINTAYYSVRINRST